MMRMGSLSFPPRLAYGQAGVGSKVVLVDEGVLVSGRLRLGDQIVIERLCQRPLPAVQLPPVPAAEDAGYYDSEAAAHIRAIAQNGYWGTSEGAGSLDAVKRMLMDAYNNGER